MALVVTRKSQKTNGVTGIKGDAESSYRDGNVTLTKANIGLGNVDNTADKSKSVASAAKLTTARKIGGVSFNGAADIDLPGVNKAGSQDTTGNAATASKAGTGAGTVTDACLRNIYAGTDDMTAGTTALTTGDIYLMYE